MYGNPQTLLNDSQVGQSAGGNSAVLNAASCSELALDVNVAAPTGTSPSLQFFLDRLGVDGVWYQIWSGTAITAAGSQSASIGPGLTTNVSLGTAVRLRWTITGTTPVFAWTASILGK